MPNVLQLMLYSYTFMVSGLFVPLVAALIRPKNNSAAALSSMIAGGGTSLILIFLNTKLPFGLDPTIFSITASLVVFALVSSLKKTTLETT